MSLYRGWREYREREREREREKERGGVKERGREDRQTVLYIIHTPTEHVRSHTHSTIHQACGFIKKLKLLHQLLQSDNFPT